MTKLSTFPVAIHDFNKPDGKDYSFRTEGPSLTRQEFADECDINSLMARYEGHVIGGPGNLAPPIPMYVDLATAPQNLLEYMELMKNAESAFMSLPAIVRKEFDNDPVLFVDFASDEANLEQMRQWGLAAPAKALQEPSVVSTAPKASAPPSASTAPGGDSTHGST